MPCDEASQVVGVSLRSLHVGLDAGGVEHAREGNPAATRVDEDLLAALTAVPALLRRDGVFWSRDIDAPPPPRRPRPGAARSALPACLFPVGTGAARYRAVGPPDELLGQAAGPPYDFAFQRNGLRRGDENSLIGDGPAGRREHSAPARTGDIRGPRGSTEHRAQRTAAFRKFEQWLESLGLPPNPVERLDGVTVGKLLVE